MNILFLDGNQKLIFHLKISTDALSNLEIIFLVHDIHKFKNSKNVLNIVTILL